MTPIDFTSHILSIATAHDIKVIIDPAIKLRYAKYRERPYQGRAVSNSYHPANPTIILGKPITNAVWYAIALHELGHHLSKAQQWLYPRYRLERDAWQWARANALQWTPAMNKVARVCLRTYEVDYR